MNSNQLIGHPMSGDKENEVLAPAIFHAPTKEHYHARTGFVQCLITRVGKNMYHFAFQVDGTETVSIIGHKLSKICISRQKPPASYHNLGSTLIRQS
jgi:hypothetical protein